jgi:hypothetical protein
MCRSRRTQEFVLEELVSDEASEHDMAGGIGELPENAFWEVVRWNAWGG